MHSRMRSSLISRCPAWMVWPRRGRSPRTPGTPVIILTAHGHPNLIDQAVEDGVVSYLLKPVTNPGLHAAIEVAVARAREIQVLQENVDQLKMTLRERKLIERAKGILMSRRHLSENEAFRLLQRQSQDRRIPMAKLAESIIQTDELLEAPSQAGNVAPRPIRRLATRPADRRIMFDARLRRWLT